MVAAAAADPGERIGGILLGKVCGAIEYNGANVYRAPPCARCPVGCGRDAKALQRDTTAAKWL